MTSPHRSGRWHQLDDILGGLDAYIQDRRDRGLSFHAIAVDIARDTSAYTGNGFNPPTVTTLTRWYPQQADAA